MTTSPLCFVDTETTGLDPRIHQPYELCIWREGRKDPQTLALPHTLEHADAGALRLGRYFERGFAPTSEFRYQATARFLAHELHGVTLVGSNPGFDAAMLTRVVGAPVWSHRMIDVGSGAMWVFDWDRPKGLADVADACRELGYEIPEPDHTAEGDVRTTRAVFEALRSIRGGDR